MIRKTPEIILLFVLLGHQCVLADAVPFKESSRRVDFSRVDTAIPVYGGQAGNSRQNRPEMVLRNVAFHDTATNPAVTRASPEAQSQTRNLGNGGADTDPNLNGMLLVSLGIALISIVRRMGRS